MNKIILIGALASMLYLPSTQAAKVDVKWQNPDKYEDIYEGTTQSKSKFRKRLYNTLEETFKLKANELPENYNLEITMLDVDLAGRVQRGLPAEVRTIADSDFPRLHFYMILRDSQGNIVLQGEQNLKERKDKHSAFRMYGSQSEFYLEAILIEKFFDMVLIEAVNKL